MFKLYGEEVPISIPQDVLDPKLSSYQHQKNPVPVKNNSEKAQKHYYKVFEKALGKPLSGLQLTGFEKAAYKAPAIVGSKPVAPTKKSKPYPSPFGEMGNTENDDDIQMSDGKGAKQRRKEIRGSHGNLERQEAAMQVSGGWCLLNHLGLF